MYETFDHTADLGLRAQTPDLNTLFAEMAHALTAALVDNPADVRPTSAVTLTIAGDEKHFLLFDWLNAILERFEAQRWLGAQFAVQVSDVGLSATLHGEPYDPDRHQAGHEVKAITYHELKVVPTDDGWLAEVIVDI
jgi:SHS2 domain-containing protein